MGKSSNCYIIQPNAFMYGLIKGFYEMYTRRPEGKFLILGVDNAGKTTLLEQIKGLHNQKSLAPNRIIPTVGFNMGKVQVDDWDILLWDVGGGDKVRIIWGRYLKDADLILYVIDSSDPTRFEESKAMLSSYVLDNPEISDETQVMILCNKQDVPGAIPPEAIQEIFSVDRRNRTVPVLPCSATSKTSVRPLLKTLLGMLSANSISKGHNVKQH